MAAALDDFLRVHVKEDARPMTQGAQICSVQWFGDAATHVADA